MQVQYRITALFVSPLFLFPEQKWLLPVPKQFANCIQKYPFTGTK
jgi:hypothetical protein